MNKKLLSIRKVSKSFKAICLASSMLIALQPTSIPIKAASSSDFLEGANIANEIFKGRKLVVVGGSSIETMKDSYNVYTESNPLKIQSKDDFVKFATLVNNSNQQENFDFKGQFVKLELPQGTTELNLEGAGLNIDEGTGEDAGKVVCSSNSANNLWTPIGTADFPFKGTFDGGNCKITGLAIAEKTESGADCCAGLFGVVENATIKNVRIEGAKVVGSCTTTAENTHIKSKVGGLVGYNKASDADGKTAIINSYVNGDIVSHCGAKASNNDGEGDSGKSIAAVGGLVGFSDGKIAIENSYSNGKVYSVTPDSETPYANSFAGGLLGYGCNNAVAINNTYSSDSVYSCSINNFSVAGGLVGRVNSAETTIKNSYSEAYVSSFNEKGNNEAHAGGILGFNENCKARIFKCYSSEDASASSSSFSTAGGIIGRAKSDAIIISCYSTGDISSTTTGDNFANAGGLVGCGDATTKINNSYASGSVETPDSSQGRVGGLMGYNYGGLTVNHGYWYSGVDSGLWQVVGDGKGYGDSLRALTSEEMQSKDFLGQEGDKDGHFLNSDTYIFWNGNTPTFAACRNATAMKDVTSSNANLVGLLNSGTPIDKNINYLEWECGSDANDHPTFKATVAANTPEGGGAE